MASHAQVIQEVGILSAEALRQAIELLELQRLIADDDDLVLMELKDYHEDMDFLGSHYPPADGGIFFYLSNQIFDVFDIYWQRRARTAAKFSQHPNPELRKDPFHSDVFGFANQSLVAVHVDNEGTFTIVHHPGHLDDDTIQKYITQASMKAQMNITFAPGLFS